MNEQPPPTITPVSPYAAGAMTPEKVRELNDQRMRADQEMRDRASRIDAAWNSLETRELAEFVRQDGNVDWREFVSYCGGILEAVALVDEHGRPDPAKLIPRIDAMFAKTAVKKMAGGMTMTSHPRNRPYRPPMAVPVRDPAPDAEELLDAERTPKPRTTGLR
jgi:hypothetical protein